MSKCLKDFIGVAMDNATVFSGSNLDVLPFMADNSVDSIVTDPPYELGFMGKSWDNSGIAYSVELWTECMRVLKPGGHLLAFGGSRTWHRLAVAIEDAGFEMRDSIAWIYGSGFPKSLDIEKAINKSAGVEYEAKPASGVGFMNSSDDGYNTTLNQLSQVGESTPEAKQWQGWGTALKPAFEPVVVARKPLAEKTVAANVLKFGTGGLNIDASRINNLTDKEKNWTPQRQNAENPIQFGGARSGDVVSMYKEGGRWPANIILDPYTAELLDEQSGISKSPATYVRKANGLNTETYGKGIGESAGKTSLNFGDTGGASRFFYVAKASKKDRNEGLDELEGKEIGAKGNGLARTCSTCGSSVLDGCDCPDRTFVNPERKNFHPTVKPTSLMEYLIELVTPPNGIVLDPFTGSGSTGKAALLNGFSFIGIELTKEYFPIIEGRLKWATDQANKQEEEKKEVLF